MGARNKNKKGNTEKKLPKTPAAAAMVTEAAGLFVRGPALRWLRVSLVWACGHQLPAVSAPLVTVPYHHLRWSKFW